jgi:catechol 2,3-dioxygenase-like lactoylglutathione lyase family enzyme
VSARRRLLKAGFAFPIAVFAPSPAWAAPAGAAPAWAAPLVTGWREAIIITPDPAPWVETLTQVGGWEVLARAGPDASLNRLWALTGDARSEQVLMHNAGTGRGYLRLVRVAGAAQRQIRPDDQAWETGGVSALDIRVADIEATRAALHARGWRAPSDPVRYHAYNVEVIQWAPVSPDGVRLSFIQRIAPPLSGWPELKRWSRAANAAIVTKDIAAGEAFFATGLGLPMVGHTNTVGGNGPNVMGLPWAFARRLKVDIRGFAGGPAGDSAVELIAMPGAAGRDFAGAAQPPNFGIAALRVLVTDAAFAAKTLAGRGIMPDAAVTEAAIPPYGSCRIFSVSGPDGVRLEFFQTPAG